MSKASKMYENSPEMKRDGEDGKMKITKAEKISARTNDGTEGMPIHENGMPMDVRHAHERRDMHSRHETEHMMHKGDKKEMHGRHESEMKSMHGRHEKEMSGTGKEKIAKV